MTTNRLVGSALARVAAPVLGLVTVRLVLATDPRHGYAFAAVVLGGVLTWLALVHSSRTLFALWMRFARALQTVAITTIFSVCYLVIVPVFRVVLWFRDPLHLRRPPDETAWVARTATVDATSMERMG
jgi:hypothetical protein